MKLIFIAGIREIDKSSIIKVAIKRFGKEKSNVTLVSFSDLESLEIDFDRLSYDEIRNLTDNLYNELERKISPVLKDPNSFVVIDGFFTERSKKYGHIPLITEKFFKVFNPNIIIAVEAVPETLAVNEDTAKLIREEQTINKIYAVRSASLVGSPIKIIRLTSDVSKAIKEIDALIS